MYSGNFVKGTPFDFTPVEDPIAKKIADMIFSYVSNDSSICDENVVHLEDRRSESVNPFYNRTESGYFLELYYGQPGYIWTPQGSWGCFGSGAGRWDGKLEEVLSRLGAREYLPLHVNDYGEYGPIYEIHNLDGIILPEPKFLAGILEYKP